jgi:hypothetical protein
MMLIWLTNAPTRRTNRQLGHGNKKDVEVPHLVEALRQHHITTVACGRYVGTPWRHPSSWCHGLTTTSDSLGHCRDHTVAATDTGEVFFWYFTPRGAW